MTSKQRLVEMAEYMEACALIARNVADIHNGSKELREHADMVSAIASYLSSAAETSGWLPLDSMTTPPTGRYIVGHRGHQIITHYLNPKDTAFHVTAKLGWQEDPFKFGATHYMPLPEVPSLNGEHPALCGMNFGMRCDC